MKKLNTKKVFAHLKNKSLKQFIKEMCGEKLGTGLYRDVYVLKDYPDYVVKIERDMGSGMFSNAHEWRHWVQNEDWKWFSQWLAPCEAINETGNILIQRRVTHGKRKDYPKYIPTFFTDLKYRNFGWIGDQFVCCDYAFIPFYIVQEGKNKMKYAKWWGTIKEAA